MRDISDTEDPEENPLIRKRNKRKLFMECRVAGLAYHDVDELLFKLFVGKKMALVRERHNKHDKHAVAVALAEDYHGDPDTFNFDLILGYIPAEQNEHLAALMDMGWADTFEAEITTLNRNRPYPDRLRISIYIKQKETEPKEEACLRLYPISAGAWIDFRDEMRENGVCCYRWGCSSSGTRGLPEVGDCVVFIHYGDNLSELALMKVIATGADCEPYVGDIDFLLSDKNYAPYALTQVFGPIQVTSDKIRWLHSSIEGAEERGIPNLQMPRYFSDNLLKFFGDREPEPEDLVSPEPIPILGSGGDLGDGESEI